MKFLIDMNLSPRWVAILTAAGFDAGHWSTAGAGDASDNEIMHFARVNDMVVLTHDLDFGTILGSDELAKTERCPASRRRYEP